MKTQAKNQQSFSNESRISHVRKNKILMAHLLCILLFASANVRGQQSGDFTYPSGNPEYKATHAYSVADNTRFNTTTDPAINLSMEALAANGYGQWMVSSSMGSNVEPTASPNQWIFSPDFTEANRGSHNWNTSTTNFGWFLLGNQIGKPSESNSSGSPGCQPPGVVSGGMFIPVSKTGGTTNFDVAKCKAAANLIGSVRYVCVDPDDDTKFIVQGLNDDHLQTGRSSGGMDDKQIDIRLNSSANLLPNGISSNSAINRQIVKEPMWDYPSGTSTISTGGTHVITIGTWQDRFDIAIDGTFLYIIWRATDGTIRALAITLYGSSAGSAASGYPVNLGNGTMPTIACDLHGSPTNPAYDAAWIKPTVGGVTPMEAEQIAEDGTTTPPKVINTETFSTQNPQRTFADPYSCGGNHWYGTVKHERILVSGSTHSIYAIVSGSDGAGLLLYAGLTWTNDAPVYVDGIYGDGHSCATLPNEVVPKGFDNGGVPFTYTSGKYTYNATIGVVDEPIIAAVNPYGGDLHCMYQADVTVSGTARKPLLMVRNADCGFGGGDNTRLWLNQNGSAAYSGDATSHIFAINQMGVHMHWKISSTHFYARDIRNFANDITENTLVTNQCFVTENVNLLAKMTIWSDPNYGAVDGVSTTKGMYWTYPTFSSTTGFYEKSNIGSLDFATSKSLSVGNSAGTSTGNLWTMPVCNIAKQNVEGTINVNKNSTWDYFGSDTWKDWNSPALTSDPSLTINIGTTSSSPGTLNIHGGATFWECSSFNSELSNINILYEANINAISTSGCSITSDSYVNLCFASFTSDVNCPITGLFRLSTSAAIDQSNVKSFIPIRDWFDDEQHLTADVMKNVVMLITPINAHESSSDFSLNSTSNNYTNFETFGDESPGGSGSVVLYDGRVCTDEHGPDLTVFDHDILTRMRIHAISPGLAGFEVTNCTIKDWDLVPIYIENGLNGSCTAFNGYVDVTVDNNTFENVLVGGCTGHYQHPFDAAQGILISGFNTTGSFGELNANGNDFSFYASGSGNSVPIGYTFNDINNAAIEFKNSTGNIIDNIITEDIFSYGINIMSTTAAGSPVTKSYICNNTVKSPSSVGIQSDHSAGYVNLCTLDGNDYGYECRDHDFPMFVHTSIVNSAFEGLLVNGSLGNPAAPDLRGVHTTPPACSTCTVFDDFGGNNNISNNGSSTSGSQITLNGSTQSVNMDRLVTTPAWGSWSLNQIASGTSGSAMLITTNGATLATIPDISNNNWGGVTPGASPPPATTNFRVIYPVTPSVISPWVDSSSFFSCSGYSENERANPKKVETFSFPPGTDTCSYLKSFENNGNFTEQQYREIYDSLRLYIELCGNKDCSTWQAFHSIDAAVQFMSNDSMRFDRYRIWLDSILYINPSCTEFFCVAMTSVKMTYQFGKYKGIGTLTVENYLRKHHPECFGIDSASLARENEQYAEDSLSLIQAGLDPRSLPPLDSIGLGIVLQHDANMAVTLPSASSVIEDFALQPNPAQESVSASYILNGQSYIMLSLFDALGKQVWLQSGGTEQQGRHNVSIDLHNFPTGIYYMRIKTFDEVKTLKLVHEK